MLEISQFSCVYMGRTQFIPSNETHLCSAAAAAFDLCIIVNANDGPYHLFSFSPARFSMRNDCVVGERSRCRRLRRRCRWWCYTMRFWIFLLMLRLVTDTRNDDEDDDDDDGNTATDMCLTI